MIFQEKKSVNAGPSCVQGLTGPEGKIGPEGPQGIQGVK